MKKINRKIQLLFLVLITITAYINILQNGFAWDDRDFLIDWPQIKGTGDLPAYLSIPELLKGDLPLDHRGIYRPLRSIYQMISYSLWGLNPFGYHIQSLIVHTSIVLVLYLITNLITKKRFLAFIVAALFAVHPIHTEAVTYITASFDTLGILFFFLSFYTYLKIYDDKFKKGIYLLGSLIYAFFAFFTYEMTLVLPILIIIYDFCTNNFSFKKLLPKLNYYKYYLFLLAIYIIIRIVVLGIGNRADYLGISWQIAANQARVGLPEIFINYLFWLGLPVNLSIVHETPIGLLLSFLKVLEKIDPTGKLITISSNISPVFPLLYILIILIIIYMILKKYPIFVFSMAWVVVALLPVSNIIPQGAALAERYLYIPSYGFILALGSLIYFGFIKLSKKRHIFYKYISYCLIIFFPLIIIFYIYQTFSRNRDWKDEKSIWQASIKIDPKSYRSYAALATINFSEGEFDKAVELFKKALEINPSLPQLNSDLGVAYEKKGDMENAKIQQHKALELERYYYFAHIILGNIYLKENNYKLAEQEYRSALEIRKDDPLIISYLGNVYFNQKKYDQALDYYERSFSINPYSSEIAYQTGLSYAKKQKYDFAIDSFNKSLKLNPKHSLVYLALANAYTLSGDKQKAIEVLELGLSITNDRKIKEELELR